ncbi:hypothetical protein [Thiomicrorhabdus xiamenensis]|uniref:Uncharacterized protein n=1 Tax=Thiomicrorhabdus xiamenensis TaxID=2739063 RepID=A0A7D4TEX9_9GAMM|nr:hypothetical protein [Thiomicrorhabdus xiamenensis]QKI88368.1 hypothetical protein HQN79_01650 [Thiomicrorhabdus xiamenensis]
MSWLKKGGLILYGIVLILGGLQVIFEGHLSQAGVSDSIHQFNGIERIMGLLPILFGGLVIYLVFNKKDGEQNEDNPRD